MRARWLIPVLLVAACASSPRPVAPLVDEACDSPVVREALPITPSDERILLSAGASVLGELVLDVDVRASYDEQRFFAARRATCMGATHFLLVQRSGDRFGNRFPPTIVVYRVPRDRLRWLPSELAPVLRGA